MPNLQQQFEWDLDSLYQDFPGAFPVGLESDHRTQDILDRLKDYFRYPNLRYYDFDLEVLRRDLPEAFHDGKIEWERLARNMHLLSVQIERDINRILGEISQRSKVDTYPRGDDPKKVVKELRRYFPAVFLLPNLPEGDAKILKQLEDWYLDPLPEGERWEWRPLVHDLYLVNKWIISVRQRFPDAFKEDSPNWERVKKRLKQESKEKRRTDGHSTWSGVSASEKAGVQHEQSVEGVKSAAQPDAKSESQEDKGAPVDDAITSTTGGGDAGSGGAEWKRYTPLSNPKDEITRFPIIGSGVLIGILASYILMSDSANWMHLLAGLTILLFGLVVLYKVYVVYQLDAYVRAYRMHQLQGKDLLEWRSDMPQTVKCVTRLLRPILRIPKADGKERDNILLRGGPKTKLIAVKLQDLDMLRPVSGWLFYLGVASTIGIVIWHLSVNWKVSCGSLWCCLRSFW